MLLGCGALLLYAARGRPCSRPAVGWLHATTYGCAGWAALVALALGLYEPVGLADPAAATPAAEAAAEADDAGARGLLLIVAGWAAAGVLWLVPEPVWSACGVYRRSCATSYRLWRQSAAAVNPYLAEPAESEQEQQRGGGGGRGGGKRGESELKLIEHRAGGAAAAGSGGSSGGSRQAWGSGP